MRTIDGIALARNLSQVGQLDIPGGGQIVVQGKYAFVGHMKPPHGTSIIDVSDPRRPRVVHTIDLQGELSHTHKVRVVGDLMVTNVEQNDRYFLRSGAQIPAMRAEHEATHGRPAKDSDLAQRLGVRVEDIPRLERFNEQPYEEGGFRLYDISDPTAPQLIHYEHTHGFGSHRFDLDERFAYVSTEVPGYIGNILVIYDIANPSKPTEVSRWWLEGQHQAGGERKTWEGDRHRLHHAMRCGNELWAACWHGGFSVLDASDISAPSLIATHNYHPPFPKPTHTVMPVEIPLAGRRIAVGVDEEHRHRNGQLHAFMWIFDVTDLQHIQTIAAYDVSERDSPWSRTVGARFGAHQFREKLDSSVVFVTWFAGGLRMIDLSDPTMPEEIGHFIPQPRLSQAAPQSNDVDVDDNGLIYLLDRDCGLDILERTG